MLRRLLACAVAALAAAPAALAGGPSPGVSLNGSGVVAPGGAVRYVAVNAHGGGTSVVAVRTRDGRIVRSAIYPGRFGVPLVAFDNTAGGVSADGSTLVLADTTTPAGDYPLKRRSSFAIVSAKTLRLRGVVRLGGDFAFDALSPDGSRLYLIQHVSGRDVSKYVVRAYDLERGRLLPGRIADRTQRGWVMQGSPVHRVASAGGRFAYTLYLNPGGYPFVHALDTVTGTAHCIGIPWTGKQDALWKMRLSLGAGGRTLRLDRPDGRPYVAVATGTWRISYPGRTHGGGSGFPWWTLGAGGGGALLLAAALLLLRRTGYGLRARAATS